MQYEKEIAVEKIVASFQAEPLAKSLVSFWRMILRLRSRRLHELRYLFFEYSWRHSVRSLVRADQVQLFN
jgi:hypothetical protein